MLLRGFNIATAVATLATLWSLPFSAADSKDNPAGQSTFISPDDNLNFAFTVPEDKTSAVYFALRVAASRSWGAVGLGSDDMAGALFLMLYRSDDGKNVTFSPRLAYGHYEPKYFPDMKYELLDGTGFVDDHMVAVVKCTENCRNWPAGGMHGGYIDVSSQSQSAIYAMGPEEPFGSDHQDADLKMHSQYGGFTIDMRRTQGNADVPVLDEASQNEGTTLNFKKDGVSDVKATIHGVFMILSVVFWMPAGILMLKLGNLAKWHKFNQTGALVMVLVGFSMGVLASFHYQRSRGFNSYHQIIGYIVIFSLLVQFTLGVLHHIEWTKTQQPTKLVFIHRWVGRIVLCLGLFNGLTGFSFAGDRKFGYVIVTILVLGFISFLVFTCFQAQRMKQRRRAAGLAGAGPQPYGSEAPPPWREENAGLRDERPQGYDAPPSQEDIGLRPVSPWRKDDDDKHLEDDLGLGSSAQKPRDMV